MLSRDYPIDSKKHYDEVKMQVAESMGFDVESIVITSLTFLHEVL